MFETFAFDGCSFKLSLSNRQTGANGDKQQIITSTTGIITTNAGKSALTDIVVRPLRESDIPKADHICRLAFGTFIGLQDPLTFFGDADYILTRFLANPSACFAAEVNGELVGSNFVANWGSIVVLL